MKAVEFFLNSRISTFQVREADAAAERRGENPRQEVSHRSPSSFTFPFDV